MSALPEQPWTAQTYLEYERTSEQKHEFLDGEIFAMTGASPNHSLITISVSSLLYPQLRKSPCLIYSSDTRVRVTPTGLYTYPDITVVCGTPQFDDEQGDTLLNPTLIVEILSPSTENYDRGKKFQHYRTLDSLQEYILIAQDSYRIEQYVRQKDGRWLFSDATQPDQVLELPSISCTLRLADVYEKVTFERERS